MAAQKKYICGYCARAFTRSEHKQRHERSHTNEKPFHCHYCTSAFVRRDLLQRHCRTVHNVRLVSRKEENPSPRSSMLPISPADSSDRKESSEKSTSGHSPLLPPKCSPKHPGVPSPEDINRSAALYGRLQPLSNAGALPAPAAKNLSISPPHIPPPNAHTSHSPKLPPPFHLPHSRASNGTSLPLPNPPLSYAQNGSAPNLPLLDTSYAQRDSVPRLAPPIATSLNSQPRHRAASFAASSQFSRPYIPGVQQVSAPSLPTLLSSLPPKSISGDTINLLSVVASIEKFYHPDDLKYPVNDMFLLGYPVIAKEDHPVLHDLLASSVDSLHANLQASSGVNEFQLGVIYCVLSVGSLSMPPKAFDNENTATFFINKSWAILVDKLSLSTADIPTQCEILKNFFILTYVYLRFFNNDLMITHLEKSVDVILQNFLASAANPACAAHIDAALPTLWSVYVLVSKCRLNDPPPKFYSWFLDAKLDPNNPATLRDTCRGLVTSQLTLDDHFLTDIIISTLGNEVNNFVFNNTLWIFESHASLHKALIHTQQSISMRACPRKSFGHHGSLFDILRAKLVTSSPPKYRELLESYVFKITSPQHWNMLLLTLREVNAPFIFHNFMKDNVNVSFQTFGNNLLKFLASDASLIPTAGLASTISIFNNNLGMVSYPLIFQYSILSLNNVEVPFDVKALNTIDFANLNNLILEWYITVVKVLVVLITKHTSSEAEDFIVSNPVLLCLFYMITREAPTTHPVGTAEYCLLIFEQLTKVCDVWLGFINKTDLLNNLKANLNRFLSDLVVLALNNEGLALGDLYVAKESILIKNKRSRSTSAVEVNSSSSNSSVLSHHSSLSMDSSIRSGNYVLMNKHDRTIPSTALFAPFTGISKVNFASHGPAEYEREVPPMTATPITPGAGGYVLPPINAPLKEMKPTNSP